MHFLRIIALSIAAAIFYGICMDNVTARVCVEYFTIGHPRVIESQSPTALAFTWGVLATWWVGLLLGIPLAMCARIGPRPRLSAHELLRPIIVLMIFIGMSAAIAGVVGYEMAATGRLFLTEPWSSYIPPEKHHVFLADGAAHLAAYGAGFIGGIALCVYVLRVRRRREMITRPPLLSGSL